MKPYRYLALFAYLLVSSLPGNAQAQEDFAIEPWHNDFSQARYLIERGRNTEARDRLEEIVDEYDYPEVLDRASSMYSETYLRERRYDEAIEFMEDALEARGDEPFEQTRRLYTATERRIRRARNRARRAVEALEDRYEDISWWNVFKIFDKLGRRKDLKEAEKDLEELEDLHRSFDPRHLFPVPALTVDPEQDGLEDDTTEESSEEAEDAGDEAADTEEASETDDEGEESEDAEKAEVTEETTEDQEATADESEDATEEASETSEATESTEAESEDPAPAASTDAEAEEETEVAAETEATDEAMNRDTAKEVLAEEIAALVALIPEDQLDQADAILGGTTASTEEESGDDASEAEAEEETSTEELPTDSAAASEETTPAAEGEEATEEPGDESSADPTEGTLELLPSSPDSSSTTASAEVAATEEVAETTAADVTSLGGLREQYYAAYQALQQALVTGDQEAIKAARQTYLTSVQAMQGTRAAATGGSTAEAEGPAAPTSSTTGTASTTDSAASVDAGTGGPAAPGATPAPAGSGVNPTSGFIRRDRAGIQRGVSDGGIRTSRGSLRR